MGFNSGFKGLITAGTTSSLHRNYKTVTVHSKYSKIPLSNSVHFVTRVRRSLVASVDLRISLCEQNHRKWQCAIRPRASTFLWKISLFTQPHKQKSNGVMSGDSNSSVSLTDQNQTHVYTNFLTMADIITSHNIDLSSEISFTLEIL